MYIPLAMLPVNSDALPSEASVDPSHSMDNVGEDEDWVVVKKQRITILIPPPSPARPEARSPKIECEKTELRKSTSKSLHTPRKKHQEHLIRDKMQINTSFGNNGTEIDSKSKKSSASPSKRRVHRDVTMMKSQTCLHSPLAPVVKEARADSSGHAIQKMLHQQIAEAMSSSRHCDKPRLPIVASSVANKVLRARLLKKRLARFGGLRNWLVSCGLGRFVQILERENLGMYQLVSLTMSQLKDMGAFAVGPRRKLIHAIDHLCQPAALSV